MKHKPPSSLIAIVIVNIKVNVLIIVIVTPMQSSRSAGIKFSGGGERGKTTLTSFFINSFAHLPGDDLFFWSSGASSLLLSSENRGQVCCRLECVQKHNQSIKSVPILVFLSYYIGQVKSSLFLQGGPFNIRLVSIRSLKKNTTQFC